MKKIFSFLLIVYVGVSNAQTWTQTSSPPGGSVWALATIGNNLFAGTASGGVYISSDQGTTWTQRNGAFPTMEVFSFAVNGPDLYAGTGGGFGAGVYKSSDLGVTWTDVKPAALNLSSNVRSLTTDGTNIFAGTYGGGGIFKSPLAGISTTSWSTYNMGLANQDVNVLAIKGTTIYAGTYGDGVNISSTSSASWAPTSGMPSSSDYVRAITINNTTLFAGMTSLPVVFRSTDSGLNWATSSTGVFNNKPVYALLHIGDTIYAGTEGEGVLSSNDNGATWVTYNNGFKDSFGNWYCTQINVRSLDTLGTTLFAGTDCGVWKISTITGIDDLNTANSFSLYPNPANEHISIKTDKDFIGETYIVSDLLGRVLLSGKLIENDFKINVSALNSGMYIFSFEKTQNVKMKFLKQ